MLWSRGMLCFLGPYPFLTLARVVAVIGGYWVHIRSRR
jgi:hypothetical protein